MSEADHVYEANYTLTERELAEKIIGLEKEALDKFFKGDPSGFANLWSTRSFTYFDILTPKRTEDHASVSEFLKSIDGKVFADQYEMRSPRIQAGKDMVVLTYQLFANTNIIDQKYNVVEVYQLEQAEWRVIHSTWSYIRPFEADFPDLKNIV